jgi:DnaJ-class molecular chaperone
MGLPVEPHHSFTVVELRDSYFRAAKRCHPDVVAQSSPGESSTSTSPSSTDFVRLTQAYELLQQEASSADATNFVSTPSEEEEFRVACEQQLGLSAEIVEECKQNPGFLQWLSGRSDSAHHWRSFFSQHGGLGPRLKPQQHLSSGGGGSSDNVAGGGRGVNRRVRLVRR